MQYSTTRYGFNPNTPKLKNFNSMCCMCYANPVKQQNLILIGSKETLKSGILKVY